MPDKTNELADLITKAMNDTVHNTTREYDTTAKVNRIDDDGQTWVSIPGGVIETPVRAGVSLKPGDEVQVHVGGGRAFIQGNYTSPPTDDTRANQAYGVASNALDSAVIAKTAADSAVESSEIAKEAARDASDAAVVADGAAGDAQRSADSAQGSASLALNQLDIIENVVGVLDLLSKNGTYQLTKDTTVMDGKWYFTQTGTPPTYQVVSNPTGDPSAQGWYELTGVHQAVQNYVSSHLVLDNNGLWLQTDTSNAKLFLSSTEGVVLYGAGGTPVAKYGTDTLIGDYTTANGFYIKLDSTKNEIGFYNGANKVAYMNASQLYVANSLSFGNFIFYQRDNRHFTLKRIIH